MNEIVDACKPNYSLKPVIDHNYSQSFHDPTDRKFIKHTTNCLNLWWNVAVHLVWESSDYTIW